MLPYGFNPNGTLTGNFWDAAASPIIPPTGSNSAAPRNLASAVPSLTCRKRNLRSPKCGTYSSEAATVPDTVWSRPDIAPPEEPIS